MKYLQTKSSLGNNECAGDAEQSERLVALHIEELQQQLDALPADAPAEQRIKLTLDRCYALLEGNLFDEAWRIARDTLDQSLAEEQWLRAVEACDVMFQSEQPDSVKALAHGIWLGVTFPIDPALSIAMLQHLIDESPNRSDGAAVAAATACYLAELRSDQQQREELQFFTHQLIGQVARRHSQVEEQDIFDFWVEQLELNDPDKFLPRLAKVLDILVADDWWYDRDALRSKIPEPAAEPSR